MTLDLAPPANALARLDEGLVRWQAHRHDTQLRDRLIQRFEFSCDLLHKALRRALEEASARREAVSRMAFSPQVQTAVAMGLVASDWPQWRAWRELRRIASQALYETTALQVIDAIPGFLKEACDFLARLDLPKDRRTTFP